MNQTNKNSVILMALAGLGSALLSLTFNSVSFDLLSVGFVFGTALAGYFVVYEGYRNWLKIAGFVCACIVAYPAAFLSPLWMGPILPHHASDMGSMSSAKLDIPLSVFFAAGFVGAAIVFSAGVFLFGSRNVGWKSLGQVLLWSIGGGVLGAVGAAADEIRTNGPYQHPLILFLVWQPGAAVLLGLLLRRERKAFISTSAPLPSLKPVARGGLYIASIVFFAGVLGALGLLVTEAIQSSRIQARNAAAYKRALADAPPIANLPPVKVVPPEQALIVREIGGLYPSNPSGSSVPLVADGPPFAHYYVGYTATDNPTSLSVLRMVAVDITQWPDAQWAYYRTKYPRPYMEADADYSTHLTKITKFGQTIVQDTRFRCFHWPSSVFTISLCYETSQVDEEFIRQYLAKYPSSL